MKIYIITRVSFPNGMAATQRMYYYAKALVEQEQDVEVVVYTRTEIYGKKPINTQGSGCFHNIKFKYIGLTPLRAGNVLLRQYHDWHDKMRLKSYLKNNLKKGDIVLGFVGTDVDYINQIIAIVHSKGAKYIRELNEVPYYGKRDRNSIAGFNKTVNKQFPICDGFISISHALTEMANKYKSQNARCLNIPIIVDTKQYEMIDLSSEQKVPYILHVGTLYEQKDGILGMLTAFGKARQELSFPVKYILSGTIEESPHSREIKAIINEYNLHDSVEFVGYLYKDEVRRYLQGASLVISNRNRSEQNYYGFSTKVSEYLASAKPLITTDWGEAPKWLKNGQSAYIVEAENIDALSQAIIKVFSNLDEARKIGEGGRIVCKECFDYRKYGKELVNFFTELYKI